MDLNYQEPAQEYRHQLRQLIARLLPQDWQGLGSVPPEQRTAFRESWRASLLEHGLLAPGWPSQYGGGGLTVVEQSIVAEELTRAGAPQHPLPNDANGFVLLGPTLMHAGTDEQKEYFLPRTISGEIRWAQGYSEPEAGSDLFNLRTRATLDGDQWVVTGQKVWQTAGITANWIFTLVRTDPEAPPAKGLSFLLIPLDQPGVVVRGIPNIAGETEFAEVFFDGAVTAASNVVGGVGNGAKVAMALLGFERGAGGVAAALASKIELNRLIELAHSRQLNADPTIKRRIARCWSSVHVAHCMALKTLSAGMSGRPPGPESSLTKMLVSQYRQQVTELAADILGEDALTLDGAESVLPLGPQPLGLESTSSRPWMADLLHARPGTIYGGSIQIQRNTIAERTLGLPREPRIPASSQTKAS